MAVSETDLEIVESWAGSVLPDEMERLDTQVKRLGAWGATLLLLSRRVANFEMKAADVSMADDSVNHSANLKPAKERLERLVGFLRSTDDVTLTGDAATMLAAFAPVETDGGLTLVDVTVENPRND